MISDGEGPVFPKIENSLSSLTRSLDLSDAHGLENPRDPLTNKYSCARCGRSYLHQATLVRHQRYECGISASYPCQLCGRKFKRRDVLKGHMEKCMNKSNLTSTSPLLPASSPLLNPASSFLTSSSSPLINPSSSLLTSSSPLHTSSSPPSVPSMSSITYSGIMQ